MVGATAYPFMCVLATIEGSVELFDRIEGPIKPEDLMARLTNILENQGPALVAARTSQCGSSLCHFLSFILTNLYQ